MANDLHPGFFARFSLHHRRDAKNTLDKFRGNLASALLTCFAIGITLALPATLHMLVRNVNSVSYSWESTLQASVFLKDRTSAARGLALATELRGKEGITEARYISREQSLQEFKTLSGFGGAVDLLNENPLPAVIAVTPAKGMGAESLDALLASLSKLPEVEAAHMDRQWLERLNALVALVERLVLIVGAVLSLAVIVTVGNTIRLDIESRRTEIEVMKLIGATDGFIRRPFLYTGLWYGLLGGLIACGLVQLVVLGLGRPASALAGLYQTHYNVRGLGLYASLIMLAAGLFLGWLGAWLTVSRRIRQIEPR